MDRELKITIDGDGNATIEAIGFHGLGCKDSTRPFEEALFGGEGQSTEKPEIHEQARTQPKVRAQ
jgi:hypothetical protein